MFCKYCGKQLADGTLFCPSCGNRLDPPQETPSQNPYTPPQQPASSQPQSGYSGQQPGGYTPSGSGYTPPTGGYTPGGYQSPQTGPSYGALPMNWYKFLIYFALFASCVINAITGIGLMTGMIYGEASSYVYAFFGGLRVVDLLIGAVMICVAVLAIIVRQKLAQFRKDGPSYLMILYAVNMAATILYLILATMVVGEWLLSSEIVGQYMASTAVSIVMMVVNNIYFKKRASLFVN